VLSRLTIKMIYWGCLYHSSTPYSILCRHSLGITLIHTHPKGCSGLGNITDSEIDLAASSNALVLGFKVKATPVATDLAREKKVEIKYYEIIYKLIEEIKGKMSDMLEPEIVRKVLGKGEVLAIFKTEAKKAIIGVKILNGKINKGIKVDIYHKKELVNTVEIEEIKIGKEKVSEVAEGQDCGVSILTRQEIHVGDILEFYLEEKVIKKI
ncbi:MAG: hypothetical protein NT116_00045, partial [Candidatus Parcubacteria bacterium]|nr:hypothetical protein [Candidatus Parcubacteria bacterium]